MKNRTMKLIFAYFIFNDKRGRSNTNYSRIIFIDSIPTNLSLSTINQKEKQAMVLFLPFATKNQIRNPINTN